MRHQWMIALGAIVLHVTVLLGDPLPPDCHDIYKYWDNNVQDCQPCDFGPCDPSNLNYGNLCKTICPDYWEELTRIEREGIEYHEKQEKEARNCHAIYKYYDEESRQCLPCDFGPCDPSKTDHDKLCSAKCPDYWDELKRIKTDGIKYHDEHLNDPPISRSHHERMREMLKVVFSMIAILIAMGMGIFGIYVMYVYCIQRFEWCQRRAPPSWIHRYECTHERTRVEGREPPVAIDNGVEAKEYGSNNDFYMYKDSNIKEPLV